MYKRKKSQRVLTFFFNLGITFYEHVVQLYLRPH